MAATPHKSDGLQKLEGALRTYHDHGNHSHYPFNVDNEDRPKLIEAYHRHYLKVREDILLELNLLSRPVNIPIAGSDQARYKSQLKRAKRLNVPVHDYDDNFESSNGSREYSINLPTLQHTLAEELHWPIPESLKQAAEDLIRRPPKAQPSPNNGAAPPVDLSSGMSFPEGYKLDPKCRFVLLETDSSTSHRINISEGLLFLILTYHQVSAAYLNFIACFNSQTGSSDLRFGGFRSQTAFTSANREIAELGRSGLHFHLCIKLRTILEKDPGPGDPLGKKSSGWSKPQAAIYHHFDVKEAKSFWIITAPRRSFEGAKESNILWGQIRSSIQAKRRAPSDPLMIRSDSKQDRFSAALDVHLTIAEWSLSDFAFYLQHIEDELDILTDRYLEDGDLPLVTERTLQKINFWIQELKHCAIKLEGNANALQNLVTFYGNLLKATEHLTDCNWLRECETDIATFKGQMEPMINETKSVMARTTVLRELAMNREDFIQKLLQNRTSRRINFLTELSSDEATIMRVFQKITLLLLPASVVSTIFSTDIVKFQNILEGRYFSFSWMALIWFIGFLFIFGIFIATWYQKQKLAARHSLKERLEGIMKEGGDDDSDGKLEDDRVEEMTVAKTVSMTGAAANNNISIENQSMIGSILSLFNSKDSGKKRARASGDDGVYEMGSGDRGHQRRMSTL